MREQVDFVLSQVVMGNWILFGRSRIVVMGEKPGATD
jgi:hypothetical protein